MILTVNGEQKEYGRISSVSGLIELLGVDKHGSAVEINGRILKQEEWPEAVLNDGDKIEIITFVGGG